MKYRCKFLTLIPVFATMRFVGRVRQMAGNRYPHTCAPKGLGPCILGFKLFGAVL